MEASQYDEHAGEHQPDPVGAETGPVVVPEEEATSERSAEERQTDEADPTPGSSSPAPEGPAADERESGDEDRVAEEDDEPGILTGTGAEQAPGVGGAGEHPAPAVVRGPDGSLHVAGEPPAGTVASGLAGSELRDTPSGAADEEAREALNAEHEPDQIETDRPDLGTE